MTTPPDRLPEAAELQALQLEILNRAVRSHVDLTGILDFCGLRPEQLPLLLRLPRLVEHALAEHRQAVHDVAELLAMGDGIEQWSRLPLPRKQHYLIEAFQLVEAMPTPTIPHASTRP